MVALGSVLCREDLGSVAFNAKQGPHRQWQLMDRLGFLCMDTLLAIRGNTQLHL